MLTVSVSRVERTLLTIVMTLMALGFLAISLIDWPIDHFWLGKIRDSFVRLFLISGEGNVPTWYASASLLLAAALALLLAGHAGTVDRGRWALIGVLLVAMSLDETAVLHEMMIVPLRQAFDSSGLLYYAWIVPAGVMVVLVGLYLLPFAWRLTKAVRRRLLAGVLVFVSGALGVEAVTGLIDDVYGRHRLYYLLTVVEETCEKLGVLLAISAFLRQLQGQSRLELRVAA